MLMRTPHSPSAGFLRQGRSNSPRLITPAQRRRIEDWLPTLSTYWTRQTATQIENPLSDDPRPLLKVRSIPPPLA